jgi:hypothetical protein
MEAIGAGGRCRAHSFRLSALGQDAEFVPRDEDLQERVCDEGAYDGRLLDRNWPPPRHALCLRAPEATRSLSPPERLIQCNMATEL